MSQSQSQKEREQERVQVSCAPPTSAAMQAYVHFNSNEVVGASAEPYVSGKDHLQTPCEHRTAVHGRASDHLAVCVLCVRAFLCCGLLLQVANGVESALETSVERALETMSI